MFETYMHKELLIHQRVASIGKVETLCSFIKKINGLNFIFKRVNLDSGLNYGSF